MVHSFSILVLLLSFSARADFLGFGSEKFGSRLPELTAKLKKLEPKADPSFEETFNQGVKGIENAVEAEKLYCSGEASDSQGKVLPKAQKELCFRELKKNYLDSMDVIFDTKKKYLEILHSEQLDRLGEIHKKLKSDLEKKF